MLVGTGFPLFELANVLGPSCRVWGADIWVPSLRRARAKAAVHELDSNEKPTADRERQQRDDRDARKRRRRV